MNNNNTQEIWMTIDEYDNYQVLCFGRVRHIIHQTLWNKAYVQMDIIK